MPNYENIAICPFYEREGMFSITCEGLGIEDECTPVNPARIHTAVKFDDSRDKKEWFSQYCASYDYMHCPYAALIMGKYEKKE